MTNRSRLINAIVAGVVMVMGAVSCEKAIDFKGEESAPYVVVTSQPEAGEPVTVRLTRSRFFLSGRQFGAIGNASVTLMAAGNSYVGTFNGKDYTFGYTAVEGDTLQLTVKMQNGGEDTVVKAGTKVPYKPQLATGNRIGKKIKFTLKDRAGESNYYRMRLMQVDTTIMAEGDYRPVKDGEEPDYDTIVDTVWAIFACNDAALTNATSLDINIDGDAQSYSELYFTDVVFDGQNYEIAIESDGSDYYPYRKRIISSYYVVIESMSRDAYYYELSLSNQDEEFFMTEPVQVQCNIDGGIGIFAAKATAIVYVGRDETEYQEWEE